MSAATRRPRPGLVDELMRVLTALERLRLQRRRLMREVKRLDSMIAHARSESRALRAALSEGEDNVK